MKHLEFPTVILGAGAMGTSAAYHLARRGQPFALIEQFGLGHDRGSSHGSARIIRHSYADVQYARLMPAAFEAWRNLEADAGESLYFRTGGMSICAPGSDYVKQVVASLEAIGCPHRRMTGRELRDVSPTFQVPDDCDVVFEPDAGMISAARALSLQMHLARHFGGPAMQVFEHCRVRSIDLAADRPTLETDVGTITAGRLIVAAGPWIGQLIPSLASRLRVERQQILYVRPDDPIRFAIGRFPVFIYKGIEGEHAYYGMPPFLERGLKVAQHGGEIIDPSDDERTISNAYIAEIRAFLQGHLPSLSQAPIEFTEICKYTIAPGENFLVSPLPENPNVIAASPCSGHGFKFSCLIGRILADLATGGEIGQDISQWKLLSQ